jgi:hypothetical protein
VLGDEDGVTTERGLPAVVRRQCRGQAPRDEVAGVAHDGLQPLELQVVALGGPQPEPLPERRSREAIEDMVEIVSHGRKSLDGH